MAQACADSEHASVEHAAPNEQSNRAAFPCQAKLSCPSADLLIRDGGRRLDARDVRLTGSYFYQADEHREGQPADSSEGPDGCREPLVGGGHAVLLETCFPPRYVPKLGISEVGLLNLKPGEGDAFDQQMLERRGVLTRQFRGNAIRVPRLGNQKIPEGAPTQTHVSTFQNFGVPKLGSPSLKGVDSRHTPVSRQTA